MLTGPTVQIIHTGSLVAALVAALLLCACLAYSLINPDFRYWPAPDRTGWRHHSALSLFRLVCGAIVVFGLLEMLTGDRPGLLNIALGVPLMAAAYGVTLWGYRSLGLENTYCGADGLVTGGLYAYSRNPQYVSSVLATLGLAMAAGSWGVLGLTGVLFTIYLLFALNEERWLANGYGRAFQDYMRRTPRFFGLRSLERARDELLSRG